MGPRTRRPLANRPIARITATWGMREYPYGKKRIFEICICLSSFQPHAVNTAKVILDIMTRHAYFPTLIITDKRNVFVSQVIHEVAEVLGINLKHAITKDAQTIGVLERAHATIMISLKMASREYRKQWHKFLHIAILNYNTTYHSSIDCEPSRVFHGRVPHNTLDHKLGLRFNPNITPTVDFAEELLRKTKILHDKT